MTLKKYNFVSVHTLTGTSSNLYVAQDLINISAKTEHPETHKNSSKKSEKVCDILFSEGYFAHFSLYLHKVLHQHSFHLHKKSRSFACWIISFKTLLQLTVCFQRLPSGIFFFFFFAEVHHKKAPSSLCRRSDHHFRRLYFKAVVI